MHNHCTITFYQYQHTANSYLYTPSLHDALPILDHRDGRAGRLGRRTVAGDARGVGRGRSVRSEEHTSELQSRGHIVCRLLLEKNKFKNYTVTLTFIHTYVTSNSDTY